MVCIPNTVVLVLWWPQSVLLHFYTQDINELTESIYIPRGVNTEALSRTASWDYQPEGFKVSCVYHEVAKWLFNYHPTYTSSSGESCTGHSKKKEQIKKRQERSLLCAFILRTVLRSVQKNVFFIQEKNSHHSGFIAAQSILTSNEQMSILKIK